MDQQRARILLLPLVVGEGPCLPQEVLVPHWPRGAVVLEHLVVRSELLLTQAGLGVPPPGQLVDDAQGAVSPHNLLVRPALSSPGAALTWSRKIKRQF